MLTALNGLIELPDEFRLIDIVLRISVTFKTPAHLERLSLVRHLHSLNRPMAVVTGNATCNMNAVVEVNKVRDFIQHCPLERDVLDI